MPKPVSRNRLIIAFYGVLGIWIAYGLYLWWMFNKHPANPIIAFPVAIGGLLLVRGTILLFDIVPKLLNRNLSS